MGKEKRKQGRSRYTVYTLVCLTTAAILLRMATGKYDEGYLYIFLWTVATLAPLVYVVYAKGAQLSGPNWGALIFYSALVFVSGLLMQPIFWAFGKIGFIPFFSYSLLVLLPVEALILWPMIRKKPLLDPAGPLAPPEPSDFDQLGQEGLQAQAGLLVKKLNRIREASAIETDPARQFQYEVQIEQLEQQIAELKGRLS